MSKSIYDYIPKWKEAEFCNNCYDLICSYQCCIWRDAKAARDKDEDNNVNMKGEN